MNCKQGDLAIVVKSRAGNEGKILKCIKFVGRVPGWCGEDRWEVDVRLRSRLGGVCITFRDAWLRPIRPSDEPDETLSWKEVPKEVMA